MKPTILTIPADAISPEAFERAAQHTGCSKEDLVLDWIVDAVAKHDPESPDYDEDEVRRFREQRAEP